MNTMNCRKGFPGKLNRNSSEEKNMYGTKPQTVSHLSSEVVEEGNGVYEGTMSRQFEGYYWLIQSKSKQFLNNSYSVRMKESQMPFNRLMFFLTKRQCLWPKSWRRCRSWEESSVPCVCGWAPNKERSSWPGIFITSISQISCENLCVILKKIHHFWVWKLWLEIWNRVNGLSSIWHLKPIIFSCGLLKVAIVSLRSNYRTIRVTDG